MRFLRGLRLGAMLLLPAPLLAQQPSAEAILNRAARAYQTLTTFQADFRQRLDDPYVDQPETRGTLYQSGASRFAMRFSDPEGGAIVIDGRHVWIYQPDETPDQVIRLAMPSDPGYGYNLLGWFLDRPEEKYRASWVRSEQVDGATCDVLLLEPLDPTMRFRRATIWFDRETTLPRRFEIDEKILTRTLSLSRIRTNTTLPAGVFTFKVPSGVKVVDQ